MRLVYLVPQQTRLHRGKPVSNLVQAAGDPGHLPHLAKSVDKFCFNAQQEPLAGSNAQVTEGPQETKLTGNTAH